MRDFLHHLLLPRESNNHRARLLHAKSLFLLVSILFLINFLTPTIEHRYPSVLGTAADISVDELLSLTNQKRAEVGLAPLSLDGQLSSAAHAKAQDMFANNYWAHVSPSGVTPWFFIKSSGYEYVYAGENLARGFTTAGDTVAAWMASPGHRDNMLSANYKEIGFAVLSGSLTGDETILVVEMFGSRSTAPSSVGSSQSQIAQVQPTAVPPTVQPTLFVPTTFPTAIQLPTTAIPTPTITPTIAINRPETVAPTDPFLIASVKNEPLVNKPALTQSIAFGIVVLFLIILILDIVIISRNNIVRIITHNIDHIVFLSIILIAIFVLGNGSIL